MRSAEPELGPGRLVEPVEPTEALSLRGLHKSWGSLRVLAGVDLGLAPGERAWVGGRNGVGKTTLLRIAAGLILPDAGEVRLGHLDPERQRREFHKRLGLLTAGNTGLYARLSTRENLRFWAGLAYVSRPRRKGAVEAALHRFALEDLAARRVDRLSMGQRQRVRLAMTFLHRPYVVLLDEPETSLDDEALELTRGALDEHAAAGGAAVICSPSRDKLELPVDAEYVLSKGLLQAL